MSPASYRKPWERGLVWHIKEFWFLYMALAQLIYTFGFTNFTLQDHERRITLAEKTGISQDVMLSEIKSQLASINTSLKYIEQMVRNDKV